MSGGISLTIRSEALAEAEAIMTTFVKKISRPELLFDVGRAAQQIIKGHFEQLANDEAHHKTARGLGAKRTGFYARAANAVQQPQLEGTDEVSVSIDHQGLAQRLFGGDIVPTGKQWLTIPARTESYGRSAGEFSNLRFILFPSTGSAALVADSEHIVEGEGFRDKLPGGTKRAGKKTIKHSEELVYFWLVKQVHQQADPTVLPREEEIIDAMTANVNAQLEKLWQEAG